MPEFLPKILTANDAPPIDLAGIFDDEDQATSRNRTVKFIRHYYEKESDKSFEARTRKNIICEEFYLLMPTRQAWILSLLESEKQIRMVRL